MILNQQSRVPLRLAPLDSFLTRVRRALRVPPRAVAVAFVTDAAIRRMNRTYRGKDKATDVLSFPVGQTIMSVHHRKNGQARVPVLPNYLGDIAIAPAVARRNARRFGRTLDRELRILILHGVLHLLGYDHETDGGRMDRIEGHLRRRLGLETPTNSK